MTEEGPRKRTEGALRAGQKGLGRETNRRSSRDRQTGALLSGSASQVGGNDNHVFAPFCWLVETRFIMLTAAVEVQSAAGSARRRPHCRPKADCRLAAHAAGPLRAARTCRA